MKKLFIFFALSAAIMMASGCRKYDDTELRHRVGDLEQRVTTLEELCEQMNSNISSLQIIVEAVQQNDYVTSVVPVMQNGVEVGYTITFSKSSPITIYHGNDGSTYVPSIGVKKDADGIYYWTLDGDWLKDNAGNKIKAEASDGQNGEEGKNGADGITPKLKIDNGYWYVSYDNGSKWEQLGKATGEDGNSGKDGDAMFSSVNTDNPDYVIFTLADGSQIKLPTWYAFEQLQLLCNQTNTNLSALKVLVEALQERDYITDVEPMTDKGQIVGYTIKFAKRNPIVIYNGKDGADGYTPAIGVKQDTDGIYYWTLDGEFILVDGTKIRAQGKDGETGNDGTTPKLKIEEGYWWVSYNDGADWTKLDKATGEDGKDADSIEVTQDEEYVYFKLADGTVIQIQKSGSTAPVNPNIIQFEDIIVKKACIKNWDTNHDGELSYEEAAAVTSIGTVFKGNSSIRIFNEFQYFINVTEIDDYAFDNCTNLWYIVFPHSVTKIGNYAFRSCLSLDTNIRFPKKLTIIGDNAFERTFGGLSKPTGGTIVIPKSIHSIGTESFIYCGVDKIEFETQSELTELGIGAFQSSTITEVCLPAGIKIIRPNTFYLCERLVKVSFEEGSLLTTIQTAQSTQSTTLYRGFTGTALTEFDASNCMYLSEIDGFAFSSNGSESSVPPITIFKIGATIPPKYSSNIFSPNKIKNITLYVPEESIELYKSTGWKAFTNILPLEE